MTERVEGPWFSSPQQYLVTEARSAARHEFVGGFTYAMAGACNSHNRIATNILIALGSRLRGRPCQVFNSDTKVRIRLPFQQRFYYPDALVTCRPNPPQDAFQDQPAVVVEVASAETRRIDEGEKCLAYQQVPSLAVYLLVEQDARCVVAFRRGPDGFRREQYAGSDAVVPLPEIGAELPLVEAYDGVTFG
ncbi:MAG: Uma2 family endonuclease [Planctomycetota bacterium]